MNGPLARTKTITNPDGETMTFASCPVCGVAVVLDDSLIEVSRHVIWHEEKFGDWPERDGWCSE